MVKKIIIDIFNDQIDKCNDIENEDKIDECTDIIIKEEKGPNVNSKIYMTDPITLKDFLKNNTTISSIFIDKFYEACTVNTFGIDCEKNN